MTFQKLKSLKLKKVREANRNLKFLNYQNFCWMNDASINEMFVTEELILKFRTFLVFMNIFVQKILRVQVRWGILQFLFTLPTLLQYRFWSNIYCLILCSNRSSQLNIRCSERWYDSSSEMRLSKTWLKWRIIILTNAKNV